MEALIPPPRISKRQLRRLGRDDAIPGSEIDASSVAEKPRRDRSRSPLKATKQGFGTALRDVRRAWAFLDN